MPGSYMLGSSPAKNRWFGWSWSCCRSTLRQVYTRTSTHKSSHNWVYISMHASPIDLQVSISSGSMTGMESMASCWQTLVVLLAVPRCARARTHAHACASVHACACAQTLLTSGEVGAVVFTADATQQRQGFVLSYCSADPWGTCSLAQTAAPNNDLPS